MNDQTLTLPDWYLSTNGPQLSKTITNLSLNILPVLNFFLVHYGVNILPAAVNFWVTLIVFIYFTVQAGVGYVRSKKIMGARIAQLEHQLGQARAGVTGAAFTGPGR